MKLLLTSELLEVEICTIIHWKWRKYGYKEDNHRRTIFCKILIVVGKTEIDTSKSKWQTWWWAWCHFANSCCILGYLWCNNCAIRLIQWFQLLIISDNLSDSHELIQCFLQYDILKVYSCVHFPRRNPSVSFAPTSWTIRCWFCITLRSDSIVHLSPEYYCVFGFCFINKTMKRYWSPDSHKFTLLSQISFFSLLQMHHKPLDNFKWWHYIVSRYKQV